ncbi:hypothetical protein [Mesorhizobium sp. M7A.F.Ca.US.010.02.1.1]|uniref:hypothetical protein n=1 Tax=Mesorhizobium sp. M7A.F.Ca.US.010.02.1.1 TaxID=2496743 RepID=UPI000FD5D6A6|nr:hypothetical protein [Mesorhizobium sp. M7A.F.Ca.US.010.02.1.1]RUW89170.1 hypothetical protein EOA19_26105 [Mesorhizobium sp. M7A.F.Ca.US.010.02.1.1]
MRNPREVSTCDDLRELLTGLLRSGNRECSLPRAFDFLLDDIFLRLDATIDSPYIEPLVGRCMFRVLDDSSQKVLQDSSPIEMTQQSVVFLKGIARISTTGMWVEKMDVVDAATSALGCDRGLLPSYVGNRLCVRSSRKFEKRFHCRVAVDIGYDLLMEPFTGSAPSHDEVGNVFRRRVGAQFEF